MGWFKAKDNIDTPVSVSQLLEYLEITPAFELCKIVQLLPVGTAMMTKF